MILNILYLEYTCRHLIGRDSAMKFLNVIISEAVTETLLSLKKQLEESHIAVLFDEIYS